MAVSRNAPAGLRMTYGFFWRWAFDELLNCLQSANSDEERRAAKEVLNCMLSLDCEGIPNLNEGQIEALDGLLLPSLTESYDEE